MLNTPFKLTLITASHCSSVILCKRASLVIPALFINISILPYSAAIFATNSFIAALSVTFKISCLTFGCSYTASPISQDITISAPSAANFSTTALPIPLALPVTKAILPFNLSIIFLLKLSA